MSATIPNTLYIGEKLVEVFLEKEFDPFDVPALSLQNFRRIWETKFQENSPNLNELKYLPYFTYSVENRNVKLTLDVNEFFLFYFCSCGNTLRKTQRAIQIGDICPHQNIQNCCCSRLKIPVQKVQVDTSLCLFMFLKSIEAMIILFFSVKDRILNVFMWHRFPENGLSLDQIFEALGEVFGQGNFAMTTIKQRRISGTSILRSRYSNVDFKKPRRWDDQETYCVPSNMLSALLNELCWIRQHLEFNDGTCDRCHVLPNVYAHYISDLQAVIFLWINNLDSCILLCYQLMKD
ncbi:hypothetical protein RFI_00030 [Reticulomyxa filosa]|uniref:Uncharacterized protein n=1 Tax=Reticulomyxa filosa TaxID=46433 RepID=X6PG80_RETFI|nr:hypothetical protein RFI_00030 [Reticulomyxa filosa]|eukprot:ETO37034.1 hypothetical protein RFI_00030 [Reticulomyxa filosa]